METDTSFHGMSPEDKEHLFSNKIILKKVQRSYHIGYWFLQRYLYVVYNCCLKVNIEIKHKNTKKIQFYLKLLLHGVRIK